MILKGLILVLLLSSVSVGMFNLTGKTLYSVGQIATNIPPGTQSSIPPPLGVKITSHSIGQQVPTGELTISGTSTDTPSSQCEVYTDVNDLKPMQKVRATGPGGPSDYSAWTFTYNSEYSFIKNGTNNLTSKISCVDSPTAGNLTKWNSVNLTGVEGMRLVQQQQPSITSVMSNGTNNTGLLISQSAALSTLEPTVATTTTTTATSVTSSNEDDDNSAETNDDNDDDNDQDNDSSDQETETSNNEEDADEENNEDSDENDNDNNDDNNDENNDDNNAAFDTVQRTDESTDEETLSSNNANENDVNEDDVDDSSAESNDDGVADVTEESETSDEDDDGDCNIGDEGFPFCGGWPGEERSDDETDRNDEDEEDEEDDDDCNIGDEGFPFCD